MADQTNPIDADSRAGLTAVSNVDGKSIVRLWADPVTHRLLTDAAGGSGSPGGADTDIQFNDGGNFGGQAGFTFNKAQYRVTLGVEGTGQGGLIDGADATTNNTDGGFLVLESGEGLGSGNGGELDLFASGAGTIGTGGAVLLEAGAGGGASGAGGPVTITAGSASSGTGGTVAINGGSPTAGLGGNVEIAAGNGTLGGGQISISSGDSLAGNVGGGDIGITAGAGHGSQIGGNIIINAGIGGATGNGGSLHLEAGAGQGGGTDGHVFIEDPTSGIDAIFSTASLTTSNKTFTFPNASGTFSLGGVTSFVDNEVVGGSGTTFTLAATPLANSQHIYGDGQRLTPGGVDYTISGAVLTMVNSWATGAVLADYRT